MRSAALALGLAVATSLWPPPATADQGAALSALRGRRVALLIGVSGFTQDFEPLRFTAHDVVDMAVVLLDQEAGAFDELRIVASRSDLEPAISRIESEGQLPDGLGQTILDSVVGEPDRAGIIDALDGLKTTSLRPQDTVLVYISTHGVLFDDEQYVVASDTVRGSRALEPGTAVPVSVLRGAFRGLASNHKVLLKAYCNSGHFKGGATRQVGSVETEIGVTDYYGAAREADDLANDAYTYWFVRALREDLAFADADGDGAITDLEAHEYTVDKLRPLGQLPTLTRHVLADRTIVLSGKPSSASRGLLSYAHRDDSGREVSIRNKGGTVAELERGQVALEPGCYRVRVEDAHRGLVEYDGPLCVEAGQAVPVERLADHWERVAVLGGGGVHLPAGQLMAARVTGPGGQVRAGVAVPLRAGARARLVIDGGAAFSFGHSAERLFGVDYDVGWWAAEPTVALRVRLRLPVGALSLGPAGGFSVTTRRYAAEEGVEVAPATVVSPAFGGRAMLELTPGRTLILALGLDALVHVVQVDGLVRPSLSIEPSLQVGVRL